jgi:outer membrane protein OmpA-like peptidoglycan-associated protein
MTVLLPLHLAGGLARFQKFTYFILPMLKKLAYILSFITPVVACGQSATDTFKLFFDLNVPTLNDKMEKKIDLLIYNDKIIPGSSVTIVGYADFLGTEQHNQALSMKRAENVRDYLVKYGIRNEDIKVCVGKGMVVRDGHKKSPDGYPIDRRVDIVMNNAATSAHSKQKNRRDTIRRVTVSNIEDIKHLRTGSVIKLKNVYFPADRHVMKPESAETLEKLYKVLKDNPAIKISIEGHVCCIRDAPDALDIDTYEPQLSVNRAKAIYQYLVQRGIDSDRLRYSGYGRRRPVVENEITEEDAEKNRRVEVRIIENN